jgi:hypothetical protein
MPRIVLFLVCLACPGLFAKNDALTMLMEKRAAALRAMTESLTERGVYVYARTMETYLGKYEDLVGKMQQLGISDIYLSFGKRNLQDPAARGNLRAFLRAAHQRGMRVEAATLTEMDVYFKKELVEENLGEVLKFNETSASVAERFDGISLDVEPHMLKEGRTIPKDYPWRWNSETGKGPGKANDRLMGETMDILARAKNAARGLPLSEAVAQFFHDRVMSNELTVGRTTDFLKYADKLIIMAYSSQAEKIASYVAEELKATRQEKCLVVCVKTSANTFQGGDNATTSLSPEGWDKAIEKIRSVIASSQSSPAFRGIAYFEYQGLEEMWRRER